MGGANQKANKQGRRKELNRKELNRKERVRTSREIYGEVQRQFRFHDDTNTNLEKKAQNVLIASALVGTLLFSVATAAAMADLLREAWWTWVMPSVLVGTAVTIGLCISVNFPRPHPVPIAGGRLLCCDRLDKETYEELVSDEEEYYKARIEEYGRVLTKQEFINGRKARLLICAYAAFGVTVAIALITPAVGW